MSAADSSSRGSMIRVVNWLRRPWLHMIRYEAQIATRVRAAFATTRTFGSKF